MIPVIGQAAGFAAKKPAAAVKANIPATETRPGRSSQAVGHMAKAAVAAAQAAGIELPRNAQGRAASAIAHGADAETLFGLQTDPPAEATDAGDADTGTQDTSADGAINPTPVPQSEPPQDVSSTAASVAASEYAETSRMLARAAALPEDLALDLLA